MIFDLIFRKIYGMRAYAMLKKVDDKKIVFMRIIYGTGSVEFIKQQMTAFRLVFAKLLNS